MDMNDFRSTIKQKHFDTLKRKNSRSPSTYQFVYLTNPKNAITMGADDVGVYEQMLKVGLRFPLSTLHRRLLQYLGLVVTQISPNAWRVFLSAEVLYGVLSKEARRMTVEEFFHCYRPSEIFQSRGMYSFLPRKPSPRPVCETPNSNRNWKSRCFFLKGDDWMCHPDDQEFMPVDKTWGIMPLSGMCLSVLKFLFIITSFT